MTYDIIIVGGGPAGVSAGVYAARKRLKALFLTYDFGGQSIVSANIENWIGTPSISGEDLARNLKEHLAKYQGENLKIVEQVYVNKIEKSDNTFKVTTNKNEEFEGKTILIATGSHRRKLTAKGAMEYENKGITYCATCDAPLFGGADVVVVGGGNAGFETASQLLAYANSVTLIHRNTNFKADKITIDKVLQDPKMKLITDAEITEIKGEKFVTSLTYQNVKTKELTELKTGGIFVEIGHEPATSLVENLLDLDEHKAIIVNPQTQRTSQTGIWAAGDCTNRLYHQNNIAAGDGIVALEDIYNYLIKN